MLLLFEKVEKSESDSILEWSAIVNVNPNRSDPKFGYPIRRIQSDNPIRSNFTIRKNIRNPKIHNPKSEKYPTLFKRFLMLFFFAFWTILFSEHSISCLKNETQCKKQLNYGNGWGCSAKKIFYFKNSIRKSEYPIRRIHP